jgi:16S rRNA (cytosine1402-N4)-methyltransferase
MQQSNEKYHIPVMLHECMEALAIRPDGVYVDVTFGGGGHSRAILSLLGDNGRLFAFDRDSDAIANIPDDPRFCLIQENFKHLKNFLRLHGVRKIDGLLADLGISSHQIDVAERGFSTRFDGPLDLRMDRREETTAADIVNNASVEELQNILWLYGELQNASLLARDIVSARALEPITTTSQLCNALSRHLPRNRENKTLAMVFQALRIYLNGELEALRQMLTQAAEILNSGGRICVMSYHSLEDRLVKNFFKSGNFEGKQEKDFYGNLIAPLKPVRNKPITASQEELETNNRSRSAKLRVAEKPIDKNVGKEELL